MKEKTDTEKESLHPIYLDEAQARMLWQLLNAPGVAAPFADAAAAAALYSNLRGAAIYFGLVK